jgi:hypothetical protein
VPSGRSASAIARSGDRWPSIVDEIIDLGHETQLGRSDSGVPWVCDCQPHAVEVEDADVGAAQMILGGLRDLLDEGRSRPQMFLDAT